MRVQLPCSACRPGAPCLLLPSALPQTQAQSADTHAHTNPRPVSLYSSPDLAIRSEANSHTSHTSHTPVQYLFGELQCQHTGTHALPGGLGQGMLLRYECDKCLRCAHCDVEGMYLARQRPVRLLHRGAGPLLCLVDKLRHMHHTPQPNSLQVVTKQVQAAAAAAPERTLVPGVCSALLT